MNSELSLFFANAALQRVLNAKAEEAFRGFGFTSSYAFLLILVGEDAGLQPKQASKKLNLTPSTITRLVEKLEYRGLMERRSKGRATHLHLTQNGEQLLPDVQSAWQQLQDDLRDQLGERYARVLTEMSTNAASRLSEDGPAPDA